VLDHAKFQAIGRLEVADVVGEQSGESFGTFVVEDHTVGEEPVADGIEGRNLLALWGNGAAGKRSVGTRSAETAERGHMNSNYRIAYKEKRMK
jgi:hypothetical protein